MTLNFNMAYGSFAAVAALALALALAQPVDAQAPAPQSQPVVTPQRAQPAPAAPPMSAPAQGVAPRQASPAGRPVQRVARDQSAAASGTSAGPLQLNDDAPSRYTVTKGDTLWSIAQRFLKSPWRWNEIWRMNKGQIRNPHRIFPGDVLVLGRGNDGQPQLSMEAREPERPTIRLSPNVRATPIDNEAIPSIPPAIIDPFLTKPLIIERDGLENAPRIVGAADTRVVLAPGYRVYAVGIFQGQGTRWQIYRKGKTLSTPGKTEILGYEADYLGDAVVDKFGDVTTLTIISANQEIIVGDRLVQVPTERIISYPPHAPDRNVDGRIISMATALPETGRNAVITLDVGSRDGIEIGHVLALHHSPGTIDVWDQKNPYTFQTDKRTLNLPDERVGLAFVFRVFERVSYALVLNSVKQVEIGDSVRKP